MRKHVKKIALFSNILFNSSILKKQYTSLELTKNSIQGRPILILGASPSALEIEKVAQLGSFPSDYVVIGCNWTNFLKIRVDFFVSAYYLLCQVAAESENDVAWVLNASPQPYMRNKRIVPVKRKNFGEDPMKVRSSFISRSGGLLYSNQNVLFLMLSLAYCFSPRSITFCGFESPAVDPKWTHFFSGDKKRLDFMMNEFMSLENLKNSSKEIDGDAAKEILNLVNRYFWLDESSNIHRSNAHESMRRISNVATKRQGNVEKYLLDQDVANIPHYRYGQTSLFSNLTLDPNIPA